MGAEAQGRGSAPRAGAGWWRGVPGLQLQALPAVAVAGPGNGQAGCTEQGQTPIPGSPRQGQPLKMCASYWAEEMEQMAGTGHGSGEYWVQGLEGGAGLSGLLAGPASSNSTFLRGSRPPCHPPGPRAGHSPGLHSRPLRVSWVWSQPQPSGPVCRLAIGVCLALTQAQGPPDEGKGPLYLWDWPLAGWAGPWGTPAPRRMGGFRACSCWSPGQTWPPQQQLGWRLGSRGSPGPRAQAGQAGTGHTGCRCLGDTVHSSGCREGGQGAGQRAGLSPQHSPGTGAQVNTAQGKLSPCVWSPLTLPWP